MDKSKIWKPPNTNAHSYFLGRLHYFGVSTSFLKVRCSCIYTHIKLAGNRHLMTVWHDELTTKRCLKLFQHSSPSFPSVSLNIANEVLLVSQNCLLMHIFLTSSFWTSSFPPSLLLTTATYLSLNPQLRPQRNFLCNSSVVIVVVVVVEDKLFGVSSISHQVMLLTSWNLCYIPILLSCKTLTIVPAY